MHQNDACKYSVVIPTYNERDNICVLIERLISIFSSCPEGASGFEIIVADDNSPDQTWKAVQDYSEKDKRVRCIRRFSNRGLSPSIVEGLDNARGGFFLVMDADLQHDENSIPGMIADADGYDMVLGTRYANGGAIEGNWSPFRRLCSKTATIATRLILGINVSDPMSGFFLLSRPAYHKVRRYMNPKGFKILLEILYILDKVEPSARIREHGIFFRCRTAGESKLGTKVIMQYFVSLWELRKTRLQAE